MLPQIILTGRQIICSQIVTADMTLPTNSFIFIKGIVYSPTKEPLPNAAVEILLVDHTKYPIEEMSMGVTFTVSDGSYGIALPRIADREIKIVAYASS